MDKLESVKINWQKGSEKLLIRKDYVLEDSIKNFDKINLLKELKIEFVNEEKINDAGGLLREWVHIITQKIINETECIPVFIHKIIFLVFDLSESDDVFYKFNTQIEPT